MRLETMTPLERAATAILSDILRQGGNYSVRSTIGPTVATDAAINLGDLARAVLQAIREPSDRMLEAGARAIAPNTVDVPDDATYWEAEREMRAHCLTEVNNSWVAMIDAALQDD